MESVHGLQCWQQGWKKKQNQASSCPVCCFPHCWAEEHSFTMHCQYSGKLTAVIESFWKLSGCYLHGKALNPNHLTSKKHRKPQSICRTTLIPEESTLNHGFANMNSSQIAYQLGFTNRAEGLGHRKHIWPSPFFKPVHHSQSHYPCQKLSWTSPHQDTTECNCRGQPHWSSHDTGHAGSIQVIGTCKNTSSTLSAHRRCY